MPIARKRNLRKDRRYGIAVPKYSEISNHCGRKVFICFMLSIGIAEKARTDAMDAMEKAPGE